MTGHAHQVLPHPPPPPRDPLYHLLCLLHCSQVTAKTLQLKRLKSDIQTVVRLAQEGNRRVQEEATKQMTVDQSSYEVTKQQLTQDITALRKTYQDLVDANRDKEQTLRKV